MLNIDNAKSYATEENLMKALEKVGLTALRPIIVCNRAGRFTAIFTVAMCHRAEINAGSLPHLGFLTVS